MDQTEKNKHGLPTGVWIAILTAVFAIACTAVLVMNITSARDCASVGIYVAGKLVKRLPLDSDILYRADTQNGYNIIQIRDGRVRVSESDCDEQVCVNTGWMNGPLTPVICLPHELVVQCENVVPDEGEPDVIAY